MIGSAVSFGYMLSCMVFPTLIDLYGRKVFFMPYFITMLATSSLVLKASTIEQMSMLYFIFGLTSAIRGSAIQSLLLESIPTEHKTMISSINSLSGGVALVFNTLYIQHISNDYRNYHQVGLKVILLCTAMLCWVPEGPRYLHSKKEY